MGDLALGGGLGAIIYAVVREIIGGIIQIRSASHKQEKDEWEAVEKRQKEYLEQIKLEYEEQKKASKEAIDKANEAYKGQIECEKNTIRLEAKIELLTRLSGIDLTSSTIHKTLMDIEKEKAAEKKQG